VDLLEDVGDSPRVVDLANLVRFAYAGHFQAGQTVAEGRRNKQDLGDT
jgi:hypothetical protein